MKFGKTRKALATPATLLGGALVAGAMLIPAQGAQAQIDPGTDARIAAGYATTPVGVNLDGKNPALVGLGSYIINTAGVCNHCHGNTTQYIPSGNPYDLPPPNGPYTGTIVKGVAQFTIDPTTFLAGGASFGKLRAKNLTPSPDSNATSVTAKTPNYAAGGAGWKDIWDVIHNGTDVDKIATYCPSCVSAATKPALLQTMPWPTVRLLTDNDLNAVWQYLSAIPCNGNNPPSASYLAGFGKNPDGSAATPAEVAAYPTADGTINGPTTAGSGILDNACNPAIPASKYKKYKWLGGQAVPVGG